VIRYWRADMKGLWGLAYHNKGAGTGAMLSISPRGWLLTFGVKDYCAGIGWAHKHPEGFTKSIQLSRCWSCGLPDFLCKEERSFGALKK
jgi:hypothetical protein